MRNDDVKTDEQNPWCEQEKKTETTSRFFSSYIAIVWPSETGSFQQQAISLAQVKVRNAKIVMKPKLESVNPFYERPTINPGRSGRSLFFCYTPCDPRECQDFLRAKKWVLLVVKWPPQRSGFWNAESLRLLTWCAGEPRISIEISIEIWDQVPQGGAPVR